MKKLFISTMMVLACIGANAQSTNNFKPVTKLSSGFDFIPASLTSDGKGIIECREWDEQAGQVLTVQLYDGDFNNYKTITATPNTIELKQYVKQRAEEIGVRYEDYSTYGDAIESEDAALQFIASWFGGAVEDYKLFKEEGGVKYYAGPSTSYYYEDVYGQKYPRELFAYIKGEPIRRYYYDWDITYTGEWGEKVEVEDGTQAESLDAFLMIDFEDYDNSIKWSTIYVSQTLINSDSKFEYLSPIYSKYERVYEHDRDYDGEIDEYQYNEYSCVIGYKIMSEDGSELARFMVEDGYTGSHSVSIFIFNGRTYLAHYIYKDGESYTQFYELVAGSSGVNAVKAVGRVSVSPRVAEANQDITVSAEGTGLREVIVSNAAGKTLYKTKVAAGQSTVRINSGVLGSGLNVVSVKSNDGKSENCKVIVKK